MNPHVPRLMAMAREDLDAARALLAAGWARAAVSRAYYAALHAAQAALLTADEAPRTHAGTHGRFAFHFVRTGRLAPETAGVLEAAFTLRQDADYDPTEPPTVETAAALVRDVARFVEAVEALLA